MIVGAALGAREGGSDVGTMLGASEGAELGSRLGSIDGASVGESDGTADGPRLGVMVGVALGAAVGSLVGADVVGLRVVGVDHLMDTPVPASLESDVNRMNMLPVIAVCMVGMSVPLNMPKRGQNPDVPS